MKAQSISQCVTEGQSLFGLVGSLYHAMGRVAAAVAFGAICLQTCGRTARRGDSWPRLLLPGCHPEHHAIPPLRRGGQVTNEPEEAGVFGAESVSALPRPRPQGPGRVMKRPKSLEQVHFLCDTEARDNLRSKKRIKTVCVCVPPWTKGLPPPFLHKQGDAPHLKRGHLTKRLFRLC